MVITAQFNGKAVSINNLPEEAWTIISGDVGDAAETSDLYKSVPFFYRCIDARAQSVSKFPRELLRGETPVEEKEGLLGNIDTLLYQIETALCVYGYAYLLKQRNIVRELPLRWMAPTSIKPVYDKEEGLVAFERHLNPGDPPQMLEVDEVVYFWQPNLDSEIGPGTAPGQVAAKAAGVLNASSVFAENFFERGAIFPMLLTVEGNPQRQELERLEAWWKKLVAGVKNAFQSVAIKAGVTPVIIGPPIKDMAMPELTTIQRENISTALGVPLTLLLANASNYATAQQDILNFYDLTVVPEVGRIEQVLNKQYLEAIGLEIVFEPKQLELYQKRNLEDAQSWLGLIGPVLTRNEGREIAGYEPDDVEEEEMMEQEPEPEEEVALTPQGFQSRTIHLEQWQRKAINRLKIGESPACEFDSDVIDSIMHNRICKALEQAETPEAVKGIFAKAIRGKLDQLVPLPSEYAPTEEDIDRAIANWDRTMPPEAEGLTNAGIES